MSSKVVMGQYNPYYSRFRTEHFFLFGQFACGLVIFRKLWKLILWKVFFEYCLNFGLQPTEFQPRFIDLPSSPRCTIESNLLDLTWPSEGLSGRFLPARIYICPLPLKFYQLSNLQRKPSNSRMYYYYFVFICEEKRPYRHL